LQDPEKRMTLRRRWTIHVL